MKARVWLALAAGVLATATATAADKPAEVKAEKKEAAAKVVADLPYAGEKGDDKQKLDLYLPAGAKDAPVLVFFHGGGYSKGDRKDVAKFGEALAGQGVAVAAVGYRLIGEQVKYPAPVEDGAKAVAWVKANAGKYGLSADRLFVGGHSAGGHLAALLAADGSLLKAVGASAADIKGVISLSGGYKIPAERAAVYGDESARAKASPITHVREGLPPFLLAYADKDSPGKDKQTQEFADALKAKKVAVTVFEAKDREHASLFTKATDAADPTAAAVLQFVRGADANAKK